MLPRRLIAWLAAASILPQAAADECLWPQPERAPAAILPAAGDTAIHSPEELPVQVTSGGAELSRDGNARLSDGVVIRQGEREVSADSATYDASARRFDVEGDVEYRSQELRVKGGSGSWDAVGNGRFTGAEFELPARPARGSAAALDMTAAGDLKLREVSFTTCPAGNDDWFLRASSIDIDQKSQQGHGRNVRIELKGVPILYAPVISFPVGDARKSGFLFPSFGNSDKGGFELGVPYYANLAPNYDLSLAPFYLSRRGAGLNAEFRYLTARSHGTLDTRFLPGDAVAGRDRRLSTVWHRTDFSGRLRLDASLADASDSQYFEDFGLGPDGTSITFLDRYLHLAWLGRGWRFDGRMQDFQTIDLTVDPLVRPYSRLPQLAFSGAWPTAGSGRLATSLDAEATWFDRDTGTTGLRVDLAPRLAWALRGPGYHLEPSAAWRMTAYQLSDLPTGADDSPDRSAPILSLDAGLVFERAAGERRHLVQTVEPRLRYTWIPFRDQDDLPVFDTALPDLNLIQLFRTNRYVGADRLGDANELAAGLTTRLVREDNGQQYLTATIGQRFYFESPRVVLPGELPETRSSSNLIGEIELTAWRNWSARLAMEWDRAESDTRLGQASLQYRPRPDAVINLGYRYRHGLLEQWDASAAWRLSPSWQVFARQVYSVKESKSIDRFAGFEYGSCCWRVRLIGRRYVSNRTGESDNSIMLQLELKGLSSVGTSNDTFLQRGIRGYSPASAVTPLDPGTP
ncbi:MAG: LPS assembly protein LptD [Steroidobacteraceae bacterium]